MSLFPKVGRSQPTMRISWRTVTVFLWIGVLLHLVPFYFMFTTSIKSAQETFSMPPTLLPREINLNAWRLIFEVSTSIQTAEVQGARLMPEPMWVYFRNSLIMVFGTLLISLPVTSAAAYVNSKLMQGRQGRYFFLFFIGTLMLPSAVTLIPSFLLTRTFPFPLPTAPLIPGTSTPFPTIRIWDTPWAIIIPAAFNAFNFLLFKGFFDTIPNSIIQAARVDGGSEFNIFRRIVLPMSIPVFAVAAYLQFSSVWDSFLWPSVVMQSTDRIPMSVAIYRLMETFQAANTTTAQSVAGASVAMRQLLDAGLSWNGLMVLGILQTIPIFIMFIFCREYLLKGVRIRGLK